VAKLVAKGSAGREMGLKEFMEEGSDLKKAIGSI
jgi:hypothetical protein